jgi:hypothetical protein
MYMPGRGLLAGAAGAAAGRSQLSESKVAFECFNAAATYYSTLVDLKRRVQDAIDKGDGIDAVAGDLSRGLMIAAEQVGMGLLCGVSNDIASAHVDRLADIVDYMRSGNLEAISTKIDSLL